MLLFSRSVMSDSLWPHGLQHAQLPCPSPTPGPCSNSCPWSSWCHPSISSSVIPFSSCLQSSPASGSFQMSQFFTSDDQRTGASASTSILPMNIQGWFPLGLTGLISLQSKRLSNLQHHSSKALVFPHSAFFMVQLIHTWLLEKTRALTIQTFFGKIMSVLFNMLSRCFTAFLPRSKCLLISWLQSPSAVILEPRKLKSVTISIVSPSICHEVIGLNAIILVFWMLCLKPIFHSLLSPSSRGSLVLLRFLPLGWCHVRMWGYWYFSRQSWLQLVLPPAQRFAWCALCRR